jgi:hypothetical protein
VKTVTSFYGSFTAATLVMAITESVFDCVSGKITDTGSGVDQSSATFAVNDEYGRVQPNGPVTLTARGAYSFIVMLQASRLGSDMDGRQYRINISASDYAGNQASKTSVITVSHDQRN